MPLVNWDARFELGVEHMDDEHKGLIELMNKLFDLYEQRAGHATQCAALLELERRTIEHFAHEEAYQESIDYPGRVLHRRVHRSLLERLQGYRQEFQSSGELSDDFFTFLKLWLSGHIVGVDPKYAKHARRAKWRAVATGSTP